MMFLRAPKKESKFRPWRKMNMKQKYVVLLDENTEKLAIQEYAELDKEMLSLLCEETYETHAIKDAMGRDRNALIQALRTHNMYPPGAYTERIADAVVEVFQSDGNTSAELFFEEKDLFEIQEAVKSSAEASEDEETKTTWVWTNCWTTISVAIMRKKG
jgi:hypothetical protein